MDIAVKFENVYKEYPFYQHITAGFKSFLFNLPRSIASLKKTKFIALKDVSFVVYKGETFGIIGKNGSGKSTILGLIAGVIKQNSGLLIKKGKISSLLELGAGFHPDLSGIENIILNGILMGNTRDTMLKAINSIIEFSELGEFIYQPLRTYSSGMYVRLGFSIAVHVEPEILLVDEALAVGDLNFQEKCLRKIMEFKDSGTTIIIVSHDMTMIERLCDRAAWIEAGSIMEIGSPRQVITKYMEFSGIKINTQQIEEQQTIIREENIEKLEPEIPENAVENQSAKRVVSWWDSPPLISNFEEMITGDPGIHFYDFLRKQQMIKSLGKGLSICKRLKGIENNFILFNICRSFDTIDITVSFTDITKKISDIREQYYDLFLCIDVLSDIENLEAFLSKIHHILKGHGFIIALEYIGPQNFQWSDKEIEIADMIYRAMLHGTDIDIQKNSLQISTGKTAINSLYIIPLIKKYFDIITIRYLGGPLHDLLFDKIVDRLNPKDGKDLALIKSILQFQEVQIEKGIFKHTYALIIAQKRPR